MRKVVWTELALSDLKTAREFTVSKFGQAQARKVISSIEQSLALIAEHPEIGREGRVKGTREFLLTGTPFIIPYRVSKSEIQILAFIHSAKMWPEDF